MYNIEILRLPKALREMNWLDYFGKSCSVPSGLGLEPLCGYRDSLHFRPSLITTGNCSPISYLTSLLFFSSLALNRHLPLRVVKCFL